MNSVCPKCGAAVVTPSLTDNEITPVQCDNCAKQANITEPAVKAPGKAASNRKILLGSLATLGLLFGGILLAMGAQNSGIRSATSEPRKVMTLAELAKNGPGDHQHVELTHIQFGHQFIVEKNNSFWNRAWVPLFIPGDNRKPVAIAELTEGGEEGIQKSMQKSSLKGIVSAKPETFGATIGQRLRGRYPNMKPDDTFYMIDQVTTPPSAGFVLLLFVAGGILLVFGVAMIVLIFVWREPKRNQLAMPRTLG